MKAMSSSHEGRKYLHIARSSDASFEDIKAARSKILPLFDDAGIERMLFDYRKVNIDRFSQDDIDTFAKEFRVDFPSCQRIALICQPDARVTYQRLQIACDRYDIEMQFHSELELAKDWLCDH